MDHRRRPAFLAGALVLALALTAATPAAARAALGTQECGGSGFLCGSLSVPLDRSASVAGSVSLRLARLPAAAAPTEDAVVGLAGGPGQAAFPLRESFARDLTPLTRTRDLIVFDQRGTGGSGALSCSAFGDRGPTSAFSVRLCADQLGRARGLYRSVDSAEDIEALRVAGGYRRLVLYGVSYGTKVAMTYAARHPDKVAALVLDSVVPVDGPDPFSRASFAAVPRILRELCSGRACRAATRDPRGDLGTLVARLKRRSIRSTITSPAGGRLRVSLTVVGLWQVLLAGDLNPALRAELPGAVRAALRGDVTPVLRLRARASGLVGTARLQSSLEGSDALFAATRCEETAFPWDRSASAAERESQARAAARRLPAAPFAPFGIGIALDAGVMPLCAPWPVASPNPESAGPLPAVPTLVLGGTADLRTPVEQAGAAVVSIPGARVEVVAQTGHSVLGSDLGGCAAKALAAFAAGTSEACTPEPSPITPTPVPPRTLGSLRGATKADRTLAAVRATVNDVRRQLVGDAIAAQRAITPGSRTGGLRGGVATVAGGFITLHRVSYVPGVRVSGTYAIEPGSASHLAVTGPAAAAGRLDVAANGAISGVLGGRRISAPPTAARAAARTAARGQPAVPAFPDPARPHS